MSVAHYSPRLFQEATPRATSLFAFVADPYLMMYGGFLLTMLSLSLALPGINLQPIAYALRWPVMGALAFLGILLVFQFGIPHISVAHVTMGMFLIVALCSSYYSVDRSYTFQRAVSVILLFLATFVGAFIYCHRLRQAQLHADFLWWLSLLVIAGGAVQTGGSVGESGRYDGLISRATGAGGFAALFLPLALYQVRYRLQGVWRPFGWFLVGGLLFQLVLSGARGAILSGGGATIVVSLIFFGAKAMRAIVLVSVLGGATILLNPEKFAERSDRIVRAETLHDLTGRLDRWIFGIEQFIRSPYIGHGFGSSRLLASIEDPSRFKITPGTIFTLHSDQLEALMDVGLLGYVFFAGFWLAVIFSYLRLLSMPDNECRRLALAYLGVVPYVFAETFMHGGFLAAGNSMTALPWSILAVGTSLYLAAGKYPTNAAMVNSARAGANHSMQYTESVPTRNVAPVLPVPRPSLMPHATSAPRAVHVSRLPLARKLPVSTNGT